MSPNCHAYIVAARAKREAPNVTANDLISVVRASHWKSKKYADLATRWSRIRDKALRDLQREDGTAGNGHAT